MISKENILFILYVKDQSVSKDFYRNVFARDPELDVEGMTEFRLSDNCRIGLLPERNISKLLTGMPAPETGSGIPRCEMYIYVDDPDEYGSRVVNNNGRLINGTEMRSWGDEVCYCADPDGHILAFTKIKN